MADEPAIRTNTPKRTNGGKFAKGVSGNPLGRRPDEAGVRELARAHTELAVRTLAEICVSADKDGARVSAAIALLDRGYGRAPQSIDVTHHDDGADMLRAELERLRRMPAAAAALLQIAEAQAVREEPS